MGYLTTFTIYNDGLDQILENSDVFCKKLESHAIRGKTSKFEYGTRGDVIVQKSRHADDHTAYIHIGNTVREMNAYSKNTEELMQNNPEFFKEILNYMKKEVVKLEKKFNEYQTNSK